jgi:hypothetical protein
MDVVGRELPVRSPTSGQAAATRTAVSALGVIVGLAGLEHGVGEILQGSGQPGSVVIQSWPDSQAFAPLSGEPAMTVVPDLLVAGVLTLVLSVVVMVWSVGFAHRRHGGWILPGLSVLLLIVGGGFAPPLIGVLLAVASVRAGRTVRRQPGAVRRWLGRGWLPVLAATVAVYLAVFPGVPLLSQYAGVRSAALVSVLVACSFVGLILTLVAARAHDLASGGERP